jgi:hypothetical protein
MPGTTWNALDRERGHGKTRELGRGHPDRGEPWNAVQHDRHRKPSQRRVRYVWKNRQDRPWMRSPNRQTAPENRNDKPIQRRTNEGESEGPVWDAEPAPCGTGHEPGTGGFHPSPKTADQAIEREENLRWQQDQTRKHQLRRHLCPPHSTFEEHRRAVHRHQRGRRRSEPVAQGPGVETG